MIIGAAVEIARVVTVNCTVLTASPDEYLKTTACGTGYHMSRTRDALRPARQLIPHHRFQQVFALHVEPAMRVSFDDAIIARDAIKKIDGVFNAKRHPDLYTAATGDYLITLSKRSLT
jgi:hypothetical protein